VLSLYEGFWNDRPLGPGDYVISADEKTSIQARCRKHCSEGPAPHQAMRIENEYERKGAWVYLAGIHISHDFSCRLSLNHKLEKIQFKI
jgi:hypothetical protein